MEELLPKPSKTINKQWKHCKKKWDIFIEKDVSDKEYEVLEFQWNVLGFDVYVSDKE